MPGSEHRHRRTARAGWLLWIGLLGLSVVAAPAREEARRSQESSGDSGGSCLVCATPIEGDGRAIRHAGREVRVHSGDCLAHWLQDPEHYFRQIQARGALFDEASMHGGAGFGWLLAGLYVLAGLVCGALASYVAVSRGHPPIAWFFLGLAFNVPAVLVVLFKARGDTAALPGGLPAGLRKVPTTRTPVRCPGCGRENHPAADRCSGCAAPQRPSATAETARI